MRRAVQSLFKSSLPRTVPLRTFATASGLKDRLAEIIPGKQEEIKRIKADHGEKVLGTCTVAQAYGGMRSVKSMVYEISLLDPEEGIRWRGLTIPDCQEKLPKAKGGEEPLPEALYWLLLTGEIPTDAQTEALRVDLQSRSAVPEHVISMIKNFPKTLHPMSQLVAAVAALQSESEFAKAYAAGVHKKDYWLHTYEDSLNLIAKLPTVAAAIYKCIYKDGKVLTADKSLDISADYARMMGFKNKEFDELMRLYLVLHSDHEGGNVSAHATHLVGSALSDPYLSFAAGMAGLAGPLHGLANQEVLRWLLQLQSKLGGKPVADNVLEQAVWDTLIAGQVVPGFGHAVLRKTDPRYMAQRQFAIKYLKNNNLFHLVDQCFRLIPPILQKHGKAANPWPNVDAHSGCLLTHYDLVEHEYYTVMFGVSRALGVLANLVWDRALGMPLERPKSVTTEWIKKTFDKQTK